MKKLVIVFIVFLLTVILVLSSFLYDNGKQSIYNNCPVIENENPGDEVALFIYIFFSKRNCRDCLQIIEILNRLQPPFKAIGVVPGSELKEEGELRNITGAAFRLISCAEYKKYIPLYSPSLMGISRRGKIYFVIPGVPGMKTYLEQFITVFYDKIHFYL